MVVNLALLHESGLDDLAMIVVGLAIAYAIIAWTGRKSREEEAEANADDPTDTIH